MFETTPGPGIIVMMLLIVLLMGLAIYAIGALVMASFRRSRLDEETDIAYPAEPQSETDRRAVEHIHAYERAEGEAGVAVDTDERELSGRRLVRQSPTQAERPVDQADRKGDDPADHSSHSPL